MRVLAVSVQGDAGQPGLPGTMGPAGKTVSMSSTGGIHVRTFLKFIFDVSPPFLYHRVSAENRERLDLSDLLVNL